MGQALLVLRIKSNEGYFLHCYVSVYDIWILQIIKYTLVFLLLIRRTNLQFTHIARTFFSKKYDFYFPLGICCGVIEFLCYVHGIQIQLVLPRAEPTYIWNTLCLIEHYDINTSDKLRIDIIILANFEHHKNFG